MIIDTLGLGLASLLKLQLLLLPASPCPRVLRAGFLLLFLHALTQQTDKPSLSKRKQAQCVVYKGTRRPRQRVFDWYLFITPFIGIVEVAYRPSSLADS